jgi:hypothetical protein
MLGGPQSERDKMDDIVDLRARTESEVFIPVNMTIVIFWAVTPCAIIDRYQLVGGIICLHLRRANNLKMRTANSLEAYVPICKNRRHYISEVRNLQSIGTVSQFIVSVLEWAVRSSYKGLRNYVNFLILFNTKIVWILLSLTYVDSPYVGLSKLEVRNLRQVGLRTIHRYWAMNLKYLISLIS